MEKNLVRGLSQGDEKQICMAKEGGSVCAGRKERVLRCGGGGGDIYLLNEFIPHLSIKALGSSYLDIPSPSIHFVSVLFPMFKSER